MFSVRCLLICNRADPIIEGGDTLGEVGVAVVGQAAGTSEGMNNKIRLLSHRAFGFHSAQPLIATIYLCCSNISLPHVRLV